MSLQISVFSGKGGTGKTSITAALIPLISRDFPVVIVDADVDASNLHLSIPYVQKENHPFTGGEKGVINDASCQRCGLCVNACRFDAIRENISTTSPKMQRYMIDPFLCEGCAVCESVCPHQAIQMQAVQDGFWYESKSENKPFFHAHLFPGHENSGKLVSTIIAAAHQSIENDPNTIILVDGPPGIGCPVISTCNQTDIAILVAEPTLSGIHDVLRMLATTSHFHIPSFLILNKADLNQENAVALRNLSQAKDIIFLGEIAFDTLFTQAQLAAQPLTSYAPHSKSSQAIRKIWHNLKQYVSL